MESAVGSTNIKEFLSNNERNISHAQEKAVENFSSNTLEGLIGRKEAYKLSHAGHELKNIRKK